MVSSTICKKKHLKQIQEDPTENKDTFLDQGHKRSQVSQNLILIDILSAPSSRL